MIYDKILTICTLRPGRSPAVRKLEEVSSHFYCERTDGLPATTLSLAEPEGKYELYKDRDGA